MKLAIIYAMDIEARGFLQAQHAAPLPGVAGMSLYALSGGHILCVCGMGKVNAAMAAQMLLDRFEVEAIINPGCAGCFTDLPVGTLVAAERCVQHDMDASLAGDPPGQVSPMNLTFFPCRLPTVPGLVPGTVATGDWFGRDYDRARTIQQRYNATVCDMEACAIAQVCMRNNVPFTALKAVSDHLFAPNQDQEYQENVPTAMTPLDQAVLAVIREMEGL